MDITYLTHTRTHIHTSCLDDNSIARASQFHNKEHYLNSEHRRAKLAVDLFIERQSQS
jgi:hypothetical protein